VRLALEAKGFEVQTARSGREALDCIDRIATNAVILDVNMPEVDGFTVLQRLKQQAHTQHIPVIMLTANDAVEQIARGWRLGADFYWTKPFKADQLAELIQHILEG
jgi:DNA-binding response OmpR family regulator